MLLQIKVAVIASEHLPVILESGKRDKSGKRDRSAIGNVGKQKSRLT